MKSALTICALLLFARIAYAEETTSITIAGNLNPSSAIGVMPSLELQTYTGLNADSQFSTTVEVRDSTNSSHTLFLYAFKLGSGLWILQFYLDGLDIGRFPGSPFLQDTLVLTFDPHGRLVHDLGLSAPIRPTWAGGAETGRIEILVGSITQLAGVNELKAIINNPPTNCTDIGFCLSYLTTFSLSACTGIDSPCNAPLEEYVLFPEALAKRAANNFGCEKFHRNNVKSCQSCYRRALNKLNNLTKNGILGNFGTAAISKLLDLRDSSCQN